MKEKNKYLVYKHTNKINSKSYIGITCQNPNRRWRNGEGYKRSPYFYNAIKKYGWDNFTHEILENNISSLIVEEKEKYYIKLFNSVSPNGDNLTNGGEKFIASDELKLKFSKLRKGNIPKNFELLHTPEARFKISQALKGVPNYNTSKNVWYEEKLYNSVSELSKIIDIDCYLLYSWLERKKLPLYMYEKRLHYDNIDFCEYSIQKGTPCGKNNKMSKKIICVSTLDTFDTITQGALFFNISSMSIINCCKGNRKTGGKLIDGTKLVWMYYEDYLKSQKGDD